MTPGLEELVSSSTSSEREYSSVRSETQAKIIQRNFNRAYNFIARFNPPSFYTFFDGEKFVKVETSGGLFQEPVTTPEDEVTTPKFWSLNPTVDLSSANGGNGQSDRATSSNGSAAPEHSCSNWTCCHNTLMTTIPRVLPGSQQQEDEAIKKAAIKAKQREHSHGVRQRISKNKQRKQTLKFFGVGEARRARNCIFRQEFEEPQLPLPKQPPEEDADAVEEGCQIERVDADGNVVFVPHGPKCRCALPTELRNDLAVQDLRTVFMNGGLIESDEARKHHERYKAFCDSWTESDRQIFARQFKVIGKKFHMIQFSLPHKKVAEIVQYYYVQKNNSFYNRNGRQRRKVTKSPVRGCRY